LRDEFVFHNDLTQGGALSPMLFNCVMCYCEGGDWNEGNSQLLVCADVNLLGGKLDTVSTVNADRFLLNRIQDRDAT